MFLQNVSIFRRKKKDSDSRVSKTKLSRAQTFPERSLYIEIGASVSGSCGDAIVVF
jgi:hypothetical protein